MRLIRILLLGLFVLNMSPVVRAMESDFRVKGVSQYPARWTESSCSSRSKVSRDPGNPVIPDTFRLIFTRNDHQDADTANRPSIWKSLIAFGSEMVEIGKALMRGENLSD